MLNISQCYRVFVMFGISSLSYSIFADSNINFTYTSHGQISTIVGSRIDVPNVTSFSYDAQGNQVSVTNALGHVTTASDFDAFGNPKFVTDPNGVVTTLTYTPEGWLSSVGVFNGVTNYSYNAVGDLTRVTLPDNSYLNYIYDNARRLIGVSNNTGETQSFTLDAMGNRLSAKIKDASGTLVKQQTRTYDELGRILTSVGSAGQSTKYRYDLNDKLVSTTNARNESLGSVYDALGRVTTVTDPLGKVTALTYNLNDQVSKVVDSRGVVTDYIYDGLGRAVKIVSPDSGVTSYAYDSAGNVIKKTDARGVVVDYKYDALNRLASLEVPSSPDLNILYTYDQSAANNKGVGHLTGVQDASGTTYYRYDDRGQRIATNRSLSTGGQNFNDFTNYAYDLAGRVTEQQFSDVVSASYLRNSGGQVSAIDVKINGQIAPIAKNIKYMPFGPLKDLTWGNGVSINRVYDEDYQLVSQRIGNWQTLYSFDPVGNMVSQESSVWGAIQYQYDALSRLVQEQSSSVNKIYMLDETGNRIQRVTTELATGAVSGDQKLTIAPDSNRLVNINGFPLSYDAAGNLQQSAIGLRYTYDGSGRMSGVYEAGIQRIASYIYNAFGQRTLKHNYDRVSGALIGVTTYQYGLSGEIIGQTDFNAMGQKQHARYWIWLDGLPLAQVELIFMQGILNDTRVLYLYPDHLNAPRLATDQQVVVWSWSSDAYGVGAPNEDVNNSGFLTHVPLRLPGQLYDDQAQLSYNYYRDYDANLGRYVQSDPIGLFGGSLSTYAYAGGNPLIFIDPDGRALQGQGTSRGGPGGFPNGGLDNRAGPAAPTTGEKITKATVKYVVTKILKKAADYLVPGGGSLVGSPLGVVVTGLTYSPGLGGCDEDGNCSDSIVPEPYICRP